MTMISHQAAAGFYPHYRSEVEGLVSGHFEQLYALLDMFFQEPEVALNMTEAIFRETVSRGEYTPTDLYRIAIEGVDFGGSGCSLLSFMTKECALCFMLKEVAGLCYRDIALATGLDEARVKLEIATARSSLLPLV